VFSDGFPSGFRWVSGSIYGQPSLSFFAEGVHAMSDWFEKQNGSFLSETVNASVFAGLLSRNGGEAVQW
jgi:hypothetical protein